MLKFFILSNWIYSHQIWVQLERQSCYSGPHLCSKKCFLTKRKSQTYNMVTQSYPTVDNSGPKTEKKEVSTLKSWMVFQCTWRYCNNVAWNSASYRGSPLFMLVIAGCRTVWFPSISTTHFVFKSFSGLKQKTRRILYIFLVIKLKVTLLPAITNIMLTGELGVKMWNMQ